MEKLLFLFPEGGSAEKYDDWAYYRKHFIRMSQGIAALDLVYIDPDECCWLIEAKDHRLYARSKPSSWAQECVLKVRDTLAGLFAAGFAAHDEPVRDFARRAVRCKRLRVVLHLEQPTQGRRGLPRVPPEGVQVELRRLLRPVDAHPLVVESQRMVNLNWTVRPT